MGTNKKFKHGEELREVWRNCQRKYRGRKKAEAVLIQEALCKHKEKAGKMREFVVDEGDVLVIRAGSFATFQWDGKYRYRVTLLKR